MAEEKKSSYWERRAASDMFEYMQSAEKTADQIAKVYLKAARYLSFEADDIFDKYKGKYGLSEQEAMRLINTMQDKTSINELLEKLRSEKDNEKKQELLKQLEAPAYQARLERLQQLQNQIDYIMRNVYEQERNFNTSHYIDLANEAYYKGIFNIQQHTGIGFSFNYVDAKTIDRIINSRWSGINYSDRIWKNTQALAQDLKEELLINLVTGRTNGETADIINEKYAAGASAARRLIRTESNYVASELNFKAYEECGIEKYCYVAILDLRTSKICRELDRKIFKTSDKMQGVNAPPMHPWCRSTTIGVITEELLNQLTRTTRNPATGEIVKIPASMSYQDWYNKYVKGKPEAELEEKKIKNRSSDKRQHKKYREILGDEVPEKLDDFQRMKYTESEKWDKLKSMKQESLNKMDFSDMSNLRGKLGNKEVRQWYKSHDEKIPELIDKTLTIEEQARKACCLRNENRTNARLLMKDRQKALELERDFPNKSFEELLKHKIEDKHMTYDDAVKDILHTASKTNMQVNKSLGLE